jgi:four helix bundle protein
MSATKGAGRTEKGEGNEFSGHNQGNDMKKDENTGSEIEGFEDLRVWQDAVELAASIYETLEKARDYSLRDQIQRAAVSISSNFAEGYERGSNADFLRFLYYAKGSCGEVRSQLHVARRVRLVGGQEGGRLLNESKLLSRRLGAYIKVRETRFS